MIGITNFITGPQIGVTFMLSEPSLVSSIKLLNPHTKATYTEINNPPNGNSILADKKSKNPKILIPNNWYSLQVLNPRIFGTHSTNVMVTHKITDFTLDILNESIAVDMTASSSPIIEVNAAINTRKKNKPPRNIPKGISLNNDAIVTKRRPGPELGSIPKANRAGKITRPAITKGKR